jgi:hypothetical protein
MKTKLFIDDIQLNQNRMIQGQQLLLRVRLENLKTKKTAETDALLDSGCTRTCVDEAYARVQGWPLTWIMKLI